MSFKKYLEAADLAESLFGKLFGKKSPQEPTAKERAAKVIDAIPELDIRNNSVQPRKSLSKQDAIDAENTVKRLEPGNLNQALQFYNGLLGKSDYYYPPQMISTLSQSQRANDQWDKEYREMFLKTYKTPAMAKMLLDKAFREMGIPSPQRKTPPYEVVPEPPTPPSFEEIVNYIKDLLSSEEKMTKEQIVARVKRRFPALDAANSRIGKAFKKAQSNSLKLYSPPPEPKERPRKRNNILKFPGSSE